MLNQNVTKLLNEQINKELFSAYLYTDIANHYLNLGFTGFSDWFNVQAKEELEHAFKFMHYLQDNGFDVKLTAIADPSKKYADLREPLVDSLAHEEFITASIDAIYTAAAQVKDYRTQEFLNWFVKEQGEEEKNSRDNLLGFDLYVGDKRSLLMFDKKLGKREQD